MKTKLHSMSTAEYDITDLFDETEHLDVDLMQRQEKEMLSKEENCRIAGLIVPKKWLV